MWVSRKYWYPTMEGISLRTSPPPWIFHIYKKLVTPSTPLEFPQSKTKAPPAPLEKFIFTKKDYQSKEWCCLQLCNGFHFILLSSLELEVNYRQSNPNYKIFLIPLNEREKVVFVCYVHLPWCVSLRFFSSKCSCLHDCSVDGINAISAWIRKGKWKGEKKIQDSEIVTSYTFCLLKWNFHCYTVFWSTDTMRRLKKRS